MYSASTRLSHHILNSSYLMKKIQFEFKHASDDTILFSSLFLFINHPTAGIGTIASEERVDLRHPLH